MIKYMLITFSLLSLAACDGRSDSEKSEDDFSNKLADIRRSAAEKAIADTDRRDKEWEASRGTALNALAACKGTIAILMSENPRSIAGRKLSENNFEVSYRRRDGTHWAYHCNTTKDRLRWETFERKQEGPVRSEDNVRFYTEHGTLKLTLRGLDGADSSWRYQLPSMRKLESPY